MNLMSDIKVEESFNRYVLASLEEDVSLRGSNRPPIGPSVSSSIRPSIGRSITHKLKSCLMPFLTDNKKSKGPKQENMSISAAQSR